MLSRSEDPNLALLLVSFWASLNSKRKLMQGLAELAMIASLIMQMRLKGWDSLFVQ